MSSQSNSTQRASDRGKPFFRERELILRSDGKVLFFRLGTGIQKGFCIFLALMVGWAGAASLGAWWQHRLNEFKAAEIVEAKLSYDRVRADLKSYQTQIGTLAAEIFERQQAATGSTDTDLTSAARSKALMVDLEALAEISTGIETAFDRMARDLDVTEADRQRIIQSRDALHHRISELENSLDAERARGRGLNGDIARLQSVLDSRSRTIVGLEDQRDKFSDRIDSLAKALSGAEQRGDGLARDVEQLTVRLNALSSENAEHVAERARLNQALAALEGTLETQQAMSHAARVRMSNLVTDLARFLDVDSGLTGAQAQKTETVLSVLERRVENMTSEYTDVQAYASRVDTTIGRVMQVLERIAGTEADGGATGALALSEKAEQTDVSTRANALVTEIEQLQATQLALVERLNDQVSGDVVQTEDLLRLTGIDIDKFLKQAGLDSGLGGPLEGPVFVGGSSEALATGVASLDSLLERRRALNGALRCLPLVAPVDHYHITSGFGKRKDPFTGAWAQHKGVDMGAWPGTKVLATGAGKVKVAGVNGGYGKIVRIDHGCGVETVYSHLKRIKVRRGQEVTHRQIIGTLGSTGRSTGPHVHYEIRVNGVPLDPERFLEAGRYVFKT